MTTSLIDRPILLVEDDSVDVEAAVRALKKAGVTNQIISASDGVEALGLLNGANALVQPCIILLDINLPRMNGLQFLEELRKDDVMRQNIVFMLTTSGHGHDKAVAYNFCVAGYFLKERLEAFAQMLAQYCRINAIPTPGHTHITF